MALICAASLTLLGLIMFLAPQKSVKAELRNDKEQVKRTKRNGLIITIAGMVLLLTTIF